MDDLALPQHHRSGAHRARRHPLLVLLLALGAVGLVSAALLWALLSLDVLGVGDELRQAGGASSAGPAEPSTAPSTAAGEPSGEPSDGGSGGALDRTVPIVVLNGTGSPGLATAAATALEQLGWTATTVGNYEDEQIPTTVLYPEDSQLATAEALAEDLGVGSVTSSQDVTALTVVLGPDYPA